MNQVKYGLKIVRQIPCKYWLVMCDAVSEGTDLFEAVLNLLAHDADALCSIDIRENVMQVRHPDACLVPRIEHLLPKYELQLWNHFSSGGKSSGLFSHVRPRIVKGSTGRSGQASNEARRPRPPWAIKRFDCFGYCISDNNLANVKGCQ